MVSKFIIYGLFDPRNGELRYIGKSVSGIHRAMGHALPCLLNRDGNTYKANWINQLKRYGLNYNIGIIQEFKNKEYLADAEIFWIKEFRGRGFNLTNMTDGGEGCLGKRYSEETLKKEK